ncbi:DNA-binding transcriptional MerR regulator [Scopulibacillus darangshiensis]|uniref:DNA-binding transcriptional MerR regulator n=1 Tax=Scopulibacillus darangshiensis TaxID=442528 RepID=A0A4R2P5G4_9BACL|nr:MerR family transcriptional regulator [Scopulibacillus darangshiensis]TCP29927.1 DNA-binding transcriptional MerR regulator [Scopulibacillus darangshiensis]
MKVWKVGELAKQTGLTVRTLHHYDQIGLFSPSQHTNSGHRIYTEADIAKLQQITSLKQLGFALEEIKEMIESPSFKPDEVIRIQLERLNEQIQMQENLRSKLLDINQLLTAKQEVSAEQFIKLIEVINMNNYLTQEQIDKMKKRGEGFSPEDKKKHDKEWSELLSKIREELGKGTPAESPEVVKLAKQWIDMTNKFTGGDPEIVKAAERFHAENPGNPLQYGVDGELYKYIKKAFPKV